MATRNFKQITNLGRTRAGYKNAIKAFESSFPSETLEDCEASLSSSRQTREKLLNTIIELSSKLDNSINPSQDDYKLLEFFQKCLNCIDKVIIPRLNKEVQDLSRFKAKDAQKVNVVKSSNYKDKKYGFRTKRVPDRKEYKRDRDIARTNKKKRQWWLAS
jgi:hypothetical protein